MDAFGSPSQPRRGRRPCQHHGWARENSRLPQHQVGPAPTSVRPILVIPRRGDRRVDGVLRDVAAGALFVGRGSASPTDPALLHHVRDLPGPGHHSPIRPIACASDEVDRQRAHVVQKVFGGNRGRGNATRRTRGPRARSFQVVAHHQHVQVLVEGVDGVRRVGFVELGSTLGPAATVISGACRRRRLRTWKAWMRATADGGDRDSTKPISLSVCRMWMATCRPAFVADGNAASIAAGWCPSPRAAWPEAPPRTCLTSPCNDTVLPLPSSSDVHRPESSARCMRARCHGAGVTVVALLPSAGPVPPPIRVVIPPPSASGDDLRADQVHVAVDGAGGGMRPLPAIISVDGPITSAGGHPDMMSGVAGLPMRRSGRPGSRCRP